MKEIWIFTSPTCQPCKALKPRVAAFAANLDVPVMEFNAINEDNAFLVELHGIRMVPTVLIWNEGKVVAKMAGAAQWNAQTAQEALV